MKSIDFSHPGGFPLTQERLDYLQQAYTEAVAAMGTMFTNGSAPVRISGMEQTVSMIGTTITDGYFFYNGELIRCEGYLYGSLLPGYVPYVVISNLATPLTYSDGSTHNSILDKEANIDILADTTPTDATHFPLSALQPAAVAFADANVDALNPPFISPTYIGTFIPDPVSPIGFRKAHGSKRVVIKGVTNDSAPVSTISDYPIFVLPTGFRPSEEQQFLNVGYGGFPYILRIKSDGYVSIAGDISGASTFGCWLNISFDID